MKLYYTLTGEFRRLSLDNEPSSPITLQDWLSSVQRVAQHYPPRSLSHLRRSFGLGFLPESTLRKFIDVEYLVQSPEPLNAALIPTYKYQFASIQGTIPLFPDDPQLPPVWELAQTSQPGTYRLLLTSPDSEYLSTAFSQQIWVEALEGWQRLSPKSQIQLAVQSTDPSYFYFPLNHPHVEVWMEASDLELSQQGYISELRSPKSFLPDWNVSATDSPMFRLKIDCDSRRVIHGICQSAQKFLLVSSYILEDQSLVDLICQRASELEQGVWILTNLESDMLARLDETSPQLPSFYQRGDSRKKACLRQLLQSNVQIRSGNFHLKAYISEQMAYFGSCNLTPGSLDFNLEAGLVCGHTPPHRQLFDWFCFFWQSKCLHQILPDANVDGLRSRLLPRSPRGIRPPSHTPFLWPSQYYNDLIQELQQFRGDIWIYSYGFRPDSSLANLLRRSQVQPHIFCNQHGDAHPYLPTQKIPHLHAKVTILGDRIAYLGGINFSFGDNSHSPIDLMYKFTDPTPVQRIRQMMEDKLK